MKTGEDKKEETKREQDDDDMVQFEESTDMITPNKTR